MRDVLIVLLFSIGAVAALTRPYYGALLWVWIGLMNPHRLSWGFAYDLPLALMAALVTLLGMLTKSREVRWPSGGPLTAFFLFTVWMGVTTVSAIHVEPSLERYLAHLKVTFMTLVVATIVRSREEIIGLVWIIAVSVGFYGIKGGIFTVLTGGGHRVWGPPDSVVNGNNEIAVALVMIVPLLFFLSNHGGLALPGFFSTVDWQKKIKQALYVAMGLCSLAAIGSQSRGALLATCAMLTMLWWRSDKKMLLTVMFLLLIPFVLMLMPESWYSRMDTMRTYDQDASAMGRINAWTMAYNIAKDRITGVGFAAATPHIYAMYAPDPNVVLVAHSIYFQVMGEHGFIGLALYLTMWVLTYSMAGRIVKQTNDLPDLNWAGSLAGMLRVSLVGFAVGGAFLSLATWDMSFYLLVLVVVLHSHVNAVMPPRPAKQVILR